MKAIDALFTIFSIVSGSLSLLGSSLLIYTILRSKTKLSVPYRRLIFGTSVYDVVQSWPMVTSIFLSPENASEWARGNTTTCDIQGFFMVIGAIGVPIYLCSLCTYYFCIIRLNMKKASFRTIEPFLHAVPITYSIFCGIFALTNQYLNNSGNVCYVAPVPITCEIFPDQECTRGEGASRFRLLFLTYPNMLILVIICIIMAIITLYAKKVQKLRRRHSFGRTITQDKSQERKTFKQSLCFKIRSAFLCLQSPSQSISVESPNDSSNRQRRRQNTNNKVDEINKQALLYVGSYILSYGFVWAQSIHSIVTKKPPPVLLRGLTSIFFPIQGFINIFIYCRPHVVSLRAHSPDEYTWLQAFVVVLKSGGDEPTPAKRKKKMRFNATMKASESAKTDKRKYECRRNRGGPSVVLPTGEAVPVVAEPSLDRAPNQNDPGENPEQLLHSTPDPEV